MIADFTENCCCVKESFGLMRECLAAKFMKIVMVMCGFRSRPIMWLSPRWLCLNKPHSRSILILTKTLQC